MRLNLKDYSWNEIDENFVLYSIKDEAYFMFNDVGKEIWNFMFSNDEVSVEDIIDFVKKKYNSIGIDEKIEDDIKEFVNEMLVQNIICE